LATGDNYKVTFTVAAGYQLRRGGQLNPARTHHALHRNAYVAGQAIQFDGVSFVANGAPANGDVVQLSPSTQTNVFKVLDDAIAGLKSASTSSNVSRRYRWRCLKSTPA